MISIDSSSWFMEFEYNGETKRIHRFAHIPIDLVLEVQKKGNEIGVAETFDMLLRHDCGMTLAELDSESARILIDELSKDGDSLGE